MVDTPEGCRRAAVHLAAAPALGVDAEWQPTMAPASKPTPCILQVRWHAAPAAAASVRRPHARVTAGGQVRGGTAQSAMEDWTRRKAVPVQGQPGSSMGAPDSGAHLLSGDSCLAARCCQGMSASLLPQVATSDRVFIFDLLALAVPAPHRPPAPAARSPASALPADRAVAFTASVSPMSSVVEASASSAAFQTAPSAASGSAAADGGPASRSASTAAPAAAEQLSAAQGRPAEGFPGPVPPGLAALNACLGPCLHSANTLKLGLGLADDLAQLRRAYPSVRAFCDAAGLLDLRWVPSVPSFAGLGLPAAPWVLGACRANPGGLLPLHAVLRPGQQKWRVQTARQGQRLGR